VRSPRQGVLCKMPGAYINADWTPTNRFSKVLTFFTLLHMVALDVFVTNGVHIKDGGCPARQTKRNVDTRLFGLHIYSDNFKIESEMFETAWRAKFAGKHPQTVQTSTKKRAETALLNSLAPQRDPDRWRSVHRSVECHAQGPPRSSQGTPKGAQAGPRGSPKAEPAAKGCQNGYQKVSRMQDGAKREKP
jgi:hypothetical protein